MRGTIVARLALVLTLLALTGGCSGTPNGYRVGAKEFAEQQILAQMLVRLLRQQGWVSSSVVQCHDTYRCHRALQEQRIDLMVEYTGTGLAFLGGVQGGGATLEQVRARFKPLGTRWLGPLGFDNRYRLLVTQERASVQGIKSIADLDRLEQGVRVVCPAEYLKRPLDGLASLLKRYGLRLARAPLVITAPGKRYRALLDGRADVAVGYATDGAIGSLGLVELDDPLGFFPPYEAAIVARDDVLRRNKRLRRTLKRLEGQIDTTAMRQLNYQVQSEGQAPQDVARRFLLKRKLAKPRKGRRATSPRMVLSVHRGDQVAQLIPLATEAIRAVFPDRPVVAVRAPDPAKEITRARAQMALLGAERFFSPTAGHGPPRREQRVEALTVLGTRMLHLLVAPGRAGASSQPTAALGGRVGVTAHETSSAQVAEGLLRLHDLEPADHADVPQLLSRVAAGKLDAALVLALPGDAELAQAIARHKLRLLSLPRARDDSSERWLSPEQAVQQPFLRPARIPAGTYAGQAEPVETLGSQVLLAGPAAKDDLRSLAPGGGPVAALPSGGRPFTLKEAQDLAVAVEAQEAPDPVLPSAWSLGRKPIPGAGRRGKADWLPDTLLNVVTIAFLIWLAALLVRREPSKQRKPSTGSADQGGGDARSATRAKKPTPNLQ